MRTWYDAPTGDTNAVIEQFARALGDDANGVIRRMKDPRFAGRVAGFAREGGIPLTPTQERAREIMGDRMFSPGQAFLHFGIEPTKKHLEYLGERRTPDGKIISDEELKAAGQDTFLVAVLPFSVIDMYNKVFPVIWPNVVPLKKGDHLLSEPFGKDKGEVGWMLLSPTTGGEMDARTLCYLILLRYFATGDLFWAGHEYVVGNTSKEGNPIRIFFEKQGPSIWYNRVERPRRFR